MTFENITNTNIFWSMIDLCRDKNLYMNTQDGNITSPSHFALGHMIRSLEPYLDACISMYLYSSTKLVPWLHHRRRGCFVILHFDSLFITWVSAPSHCLQYQMEYYPVLDFKNRCSPRTVKCHHYLSVIISRWKSFLGMPIWNFIDCWWLFLRVFWNFSRKQQCNLVIKSERKIWACLVFLFYFLL